MSKQLSQLTTSIKGRIILSFSILIFIAIIASVILFSTIRKSQAYLSEMYSQKSETVVQLDSLRKTSELIGNSISNWVKLNDITKIKSSAPQWKANIQVIDTTLATAKKRWSAADQATYEKIRSEINFLSEQLAAFMATLQTYEDYASDEFYELETKLSKEINPRFESLLPKIDEFIAEKRTESTRMIIQDNFSIISNGLMGMAVLIILVSIVAFFYINRTVQRPIVEVQRVLAQIGQGRLNTNIPRVKNEFNTVYEHLDGVMQQFGTVVNNVKSMGQELNSSSKEVRLLSDSVSDSASSQAASVQEMATSIEEMVVTIINSQENVDGIKQLSQQITKHIENTTEAVAKLTNALSHIGSKAQVINEIARQTNLLSLNAAVEAARAGDEGRGFAVVAQEVRKLAENSLAAAAEINVLTDDSNELSLNSKELFNDIIPMIEESMELIQTLTQTSVEQKATAENIDNGIKTLNTVVTINSEKLAERSLEMKKHAENLLKAIGFFSNK